MKNISFPITNEEIETLEIEDQILISGKFFCGRDAVLPKIIELYKAGKLEEKGIDLNGGLIFHTAVSPAGVGPTSSNKKEIEDSIVILSKAGIKMHLGKGKLKEDTIKGLEEYGSVYAVIPPVTALLESKTISKKVVAFPELGMEAFYELEVKDYPAVVAISKGRSIYDK